MPVLCIPITEVPNRLKEIPKGKHIGIFCSGGVRATIVYLYLTSFCQKTASKKRETPQKIHEQFDSYGYLSSKWVQI